MRIKRDAGSLWLDIDYIGAPQSQPVRQIADQARHPLLGHRERDFYLVAWG